MNLSTKLTTIRHKCSDSYHLSAQRAYFYKTADQVCHKEFSTLWIRNEFSSLNGNGLVVKVVSSLNSIISSLNGSIRTWNIKHKLRTIFQPRSLKYREDGKNFGNTISTCGQNFRITIAATGENETYGGINPVHARHESNHCIWCTLPNIKSKFYWRAREYNIIVNWENGICSQILNFFKSVVQAVFGIDIKFQFNMSPISSIQLYNVV